MSNYLEPYRSPVFPFLVFSALAGACLGACGTDSAASACASCGDAATDGLLPDGPTADGPGGDSAVADVAAGSDGGAVVDADAGTLACPAGAFVGGLIVTPGQNLVLATSCDVNGDLVIGTAGGASATLAVRGAILTVHGNITLDGAGNLTVSGAGSALRLDNQSNFQRSINAHGTSSVTLDGCSLVTNLTGANNFTSVYNAYDSTVFTATNVTIDTDRSWLLGNLRNSSTVTSTNSSAPVEIYANDQSTVNSNGASDQHGIWLVFASGSSGSITLPNPTMPVTWSAGRNSGQSVGWQVNINGAKEGLDIESHAGSSWQIHGSGAGVKDATIGLFIDPPTTPSQPMILNALPLNVVGTESAPFTLTPPDATSPQLSLYGVDLGPLGWQIYVGGGGAPSVKATISGSTINEVGVFAGGQVEFSNNVAQLAVLEAMGANASLHLTESDLWSQDIIGAQGGTIKVDTSKVHGSLLEADKGGVLQITDALTTFYANGKSSACVMDDAFYQYLVDHGGLPMCNPYTNPGQLSQRLNAGGTLAISGGHPACFASGGAYVPGFVFDAGPNTANPAGGSVHCTGGQNPLSATFTKYPVNLPDAAPGDVDTCIVTTSGGMDSYTMTAPTCQ